MRPGVAAKRITRGGPVTEKLCLVGVFSGSEAVDKTVDRRHVLCFQRLDDGADGIGAEFAGRQWAVRGQVVEGEGDLWGGLLCVRGRRDDGDQECEDEAKRSHHEVSLVYGNRKGVAEATPFDSLLMLA